MLLGSTPSQHRVTFRSRFEGRRLCRLLSFLQLQCLLLCVAAYGVVWAEAPHPLVRDVRIRVPDASERPFEVIHGLESPGPVSPSGQIGRGLLSFYGCETCHGLENSQVSRRWGPDLDNIGQKTTGDWLRRWLEDPSKSLPGARMPRVPLSEEERGNLVAFLTSVRGIELGPAPASGSRARGEALYDSSGCSACHRVGGLGGTLGPALDRIGEKVRPEWLLAYLADPKSMIPNARMPRFDLSEDDIGDLAAFLLGEALGRLKLDPGPPSGPSESISGGLSTFAQRGCAGCHRIGALSVPLEHPAAEEGLRFALHHGLVPRFGSPQISLREEEVAEISQALLLKRGAGTGVEDELFLQTFWETPIPHQGEAPAAYHALAKDLRAESCGGCHPQQSQEWQTTRHSLSMGPGVVGQLIDRTEDERFTAGCLSCHAPAAEQQEKGEQLNPTIQAEGITCLVCHVRSHIRFGPPPGARPPAQVWRSPGHAGGTASTAFQSSAFCRHCHQFDEDGFRLNGKLLQDTYGEWLQSPQAANGETCQTCHMPERRHTWKGIHDPPIVRDAVSLEINPITAGPDTVAAEISISNRGAGHHLPTYVTPMIYVEARLLSKDLKPVEGSEARRAIGREIILSWNENREVFDTRIPAGGKWLWRYSAERGSESDRLQVRVEVHPDHFYLGFFESYGRNGLSPDGAAKIDSAEAVARQSPYTLLERTWRLSQLSGEGMMRH